MVIVMEENASEEDIQTVIGKLVDRNFDVHRSTGVRHTVLGAIGDKRGLDLRLFELLPGVHEVLRITEPYKLASRTFRSDDTVVKVKGVEFGAGLTLQPPRHTCSPTSRQNMVLHSRLRFVEAFAQDRGEKGLNVHHHSSHEFLN